MDNTPVQNVQAMDQFKQVRADFERMARLNKDALTPQELDRMAMDEVHERMGAREQGESPEALRAIKPANAGQAARLQSLLHARVGDLAQDQQEGANEPGFAARALSGFFSTPGVGAIGTPGPEASAIQQAGETGAQNIAGLYGAIASHIPGGRNFAQGAQEFSQGIAPDARGGNQLAQTVGDVAGGYAGTYPLAAGIEKAIPAVPLLGKLTQGLGGKLAGALPEEAPGFLRAGAQALPREVATGEAFQGLTGGPSSLGTPQGQGNALGLAALGTGMRGLGGIGGRAQALNDMLKGKGPELGPGESNRIVPQEEVAGNRQAAMRAQTPAFMRNRTAEGAPEVPAEIDPHQPFEEGAVPQAPTPNSSQDVADMYRQIDEELGLTAAKGGAPVEGAGFQAAVAAAAGGGGAGINPEDITRSLDAAASSRSKSNL